MNNIAITPQILMYALQQQNVKREILKKHPIEELNKCVQGDNVVTDSVNINKQEDDDRSAENKALVGGSAI